MGVGLIHHGAANDRFLANWQPGSFDVNDGWWQDGRTIGERGWDLYQNNPFARAMVETILGGTFGAQGLVFRSAYSIDDDPQVSDAELEVRRQIDACVSRAVAGQRADVAGVMSWVDMHKALRVSRRVAGDGFAVRLYRPNRPHAVYGTCWRLIDPARVCNPNFGANSKTLFEGFELDAEGTPVAIHVVSVHPNLMRYGEERRWTRIPIFAPDGTRNVIHVRAPGRPDQIRGLGAFSPVMTDLKHLDDIKLAWVVAKKANASIAYFINTKNPAQAAATDKNGAVINGTVGIKPLMKYYLGPDDKIQTFQFPFQGAEFDELLVSMLQGPCGSWALPVEMVLRRLTKSNLASSRAALMDYYETCEREQDEHIAQAYQPMIAAIIMEGVARGEIDAPTDDLMRLTAGRYLRPSRSFPDPKKEADAAAAWIALGASKSTVFATAGMSFDDETAQKRQDQEYEQAQGVVDTPPAAPGAPASPGTPAQQPQQEPDGDDTDEPGAAPAKEQAA